MGLIYGNKIIQMPLISHLFSTTSRVGGSLFQQILKPFSINQEDKFEKYSYTELSINQDKIEGENTNCYITYHAFNPTDKEVSLSTITNSYNCLLQAVGA